MTQLAFLASGSSEAQNAKKKLQAAYGKVTAGKADVLVVLGGDGFMLSSLHKYGHLKKPLFGMKLGKVGFLMNRFTKDDVAERIGKAQAVDLKPLKMIATGADGQQTEALAINEISLWRQTNQAAHLRISINDIVRIPELMADGVLLSTAAGSTAYNLSAHGPILPLGTEALALTPISPFRPRRWRGAVLPNKTRVTVEVLNHKKRPVNAAADSDEVADVVRVDMHLQQDIFYRLLFDPDHSLEERVLNEQFL